MLEPLIFLRRMARPPPQRSGWGWSFGSLILVPSVLCGALSAWYAWSCQRNYNSGLGKLISYRRLPISGSDESLRQLELNDPPVPAGSE
jgi:hypothetical protein